MKKLTISFAVVMMVAGFAFSALADPGRYDGRRFDDRGYQNQIHQRYYDRDHRPYSDYRWSQHRPVIVHRVPAGPPPARMRVYAPYAPGFSLCLPNLSIIVRQERLLKKTQIKF